jgi:hypothetical protein
VTVTSMFFTGEGVGEGLAYLTYLILQLMSPSRSYTRSSVSRARKNEVKIKHEVRRRSADAELWRTAIARQDNRFSTLTALRLACQP